MRFRSSFAISYAFQDDFFSVIIISISSLSSSARLRTTYIDPILNKVWQSSQSQGIMKAVWYRPSSCKSQRPVTWRFQYLWKQLLAQLIVLPNYGEHPSILRSSHSTQPLANHSTVHTFGRIMRPQSCWSQTTPGFRALFVGRSSISLWDGEWQSLRRPHALQGMFGKGSIIREKAYTYSTSTTSPAWALRWTLSKMASRYPWAAT